MEAKKVYLKKFAATLDGGRGQYDANYGLYANNLQVTQTLAKLEELITEFESAFPNDLNLQRTRLQSHKDIGEKRLGQNQRMLNLIIQQDNGADGFWKDIAEWSLRK